MQSSVTKESSNTINNPASAAVRVWESTYQTVKQGLNRLESSQTTANRTVIHLTLILVTVLAIGLSNLELAWGTINTVRPIKYDPVETPASNLATEDNTPLLLPTELGDAQSDVLFRAAVPRTIIPDRSQPQQAPAQTEPEIRIYAVESGDTLSGVAEKFGLNPETIVWANRQLEKNPDLLYVGQELIILPVDGVYHQVGGGDTIAGIAATFKVDPEAIINYPLNELDPDNLLLQIGQWLIVPGGNKPFVPRTVIAYSGPVPADATVGSGIFGWPTSGRITQAYFAFHPGLDIGGWVGAPVLAADSGHVVATGWDNTGYGNTIVIDHGNGFQTLYAHLEAFNVQQGENVAKGQQIGQVGSTGNSTGPHLHFEIRQGTVQRNPYGFLP